MKAALILVLTSSLALANTPSFTVDPFEDARVSDEVVADASYGSNSDGLDDNLDLNDSFDRGEDGLTEMPEFEKEPAFEALTREDMAQLEGIYESSVSTKYSGVKKDKKKSKKAKKASKKSKTKNKKRK